MEYANFNAPRNSISWSFSMSSTLTHNLIYDDEQLQWLMTNGIASTYGRIRRPKQITIIKWNKIMKTYRKRRPFERFSSENAVNNPKWANVVVNQASWLPLWHLLTCFQWKSAKLWCCKNWFIQCFAYSVLTFTWKLMQSWISKLYLPLPQSFTCWSESEFLNHPRFLRFLPSVSSVCLCMIVIMMILSLSTCLIGGEGRRTHGERNYTAPNSFPFLHLTLGCVHILVS